MGSRNVITMSRNWGKYAVILPSHFGRCSSTLVSSEVDGIKGRAYQIHLKSFSGLPRSSASLSGLFRGFYPLFCWLKKEKASFPSVQHILLGAQRGPFCISGKASRTQSFELFLPLKLTMVVPLSCQFHRWKANLFLDSIDISED